MKQNQRSHNFVWVGTRDPLTLSGPERYLNLISYDNAIFNRSVCIKLFLKCPLAI